MKFLLRGGADKQRNTTRRSRRPSFFRSNSSPSPCSFPTSQEVEDLKIAAGYTDSTDELEDYYYGCYNNGSSSSLVGVVVDEEDEAALEALPPEPKQEQGKDDPCEFRQDDFAAANVLEPDHHSACHAPLPAIPVPVQRSSSPPPRSSSRRPRITPPTEVTIDPTTLMLLQQFPMSPMRNDETNHALPAPPPVSPTEHTIALLQAQLRDAQRLVRAVLGEHDHHNNHNNSSIMQAIRAFALMKQELNALRQQQALWDGDPPAVLSHLTSPTSTTSSLRVTPKKQRDSPFSFSKNSESPNNNSNSNSSDHHSSQYGTPSSRNEDDSDPNIVLLVPPPAKNACSNAAHQCQKRMAQDLVLAKRLLDEKDQRIRELEEEALFLATTARGSSTTFPPPAHSKAAAASPLSTSTTTLHHYDSTTTTMIMRIDSEKQHHERTSSF